MLHIGGCDEASHRKNGGEKERFPAEIDRTVFAELKFSGHTVKVVSDHTTDPKSGRHITEKQPLFIFD